MMFISYHYATKRRYPTESAFDYISFPVVIPKTIILSSHISMILPVRYEKTYASPFEFFAGRITIIGFIPNKSSRVGSWPPRSFFGDFDLLKSSFEQLDLRRRSRVNMDSQRNPLTINNYHALRTLSSLRRSNSQTPFFAGIKLASTKESSQSSACL